jgi:hypothetical protein
LPVDPFLFIPITIRVYVESLAVFFRAFEGSFEAGSVLGKNFTHPMFGTVLPLAFIPIPGAIEVHAITMSLVVYPGTYIQLPSIIIHDPVAMHHVAEPGPLIPIPIVMEVNPLPVSGFVLNCSVEDVSVAVLNYAFQILRVGTSHL